MADEVTQIFDYHDATKHHLYRYAPGPGGLDWATQPDPFRRYTGAPLLKLDHIPPSDKPLFEPVFVEGHLPPQPIDRTSISRLFYDSLALSAWKEVGNVRWALRVNPSSGNLHPTEGYLISGPVAGLCEQPMVGHYAPKEHALEQRAVFSAETWNTLTANLPASSVLVGLSSIYWREAWKYGERAFRYCHHDAGHAIAAVALAAAGMGWKAIVLDDLSTYALASLMGLFDPHRVEPEQPECLLAIYPQGTTCAETAVPDNIASAFQSLPWQGTPNQLSSSHVDWRMIDKAKTATRKPSSRRIYSEPKSTGSPIKVGDAPISFRKIVHQRRSCLALDGHTGIAATALYQILQKTIPGPGQFPFNALPWGPSIHFGLFVHRVQDVDPGIYFLVRDPSKLDLLKHLMKKEFIWEKPKGCPEGLELYRLLSGDARELAQQVSCHQEIAAAGCFSLGMIAEFEEPIRRYGAWFYPRLFWEAGAIGQVLYLEAEAYGIRGTGIGCFFDEPMHAVLGLTDRRFQDLYHFTIGGPVEDKRLTTLPAYPSTTQGSEESPPGHFDLP